MSSTDATHDKRDVVVLAGFVLRESDLVATLDVIDRAEIAVLRRDDGHVRLDELSGDIGVQQDPSSSIGRASERIRMVRGCTMYRNRINMQSP